MPTQQTTYNSRVTDEALEKKFRDTFKSQGGAELVDDLYAQGVIVPIVDFTAAAQGSELRSDLQTAWDFATGHNTTNNGTTTNISTPGFWQVNLNHVVQDPSGSVESQVVIEDASGTTKVIWEYNIPASTATGAVSITSTPFVVFLRSGDLLKSKSFTTFGTIDLWYRQIADVSGNLVNPLGFTSS